MSELIVITTYFNPCRYVTRRNNYRLFIEGMNRSGVTCITVECAFSDQEFELPDSLNTIQIRSNSMLWQKERLLNLAASWLPPTCKYVAWIDCDVLFQNTNWARDLVAVMRKKKVAQLFETCRRLGPGGIGEAEPVAQSFAAVMNRSPETLEAGRYDLHGHTGYAWAMTKQLFDEIGLYESAVSGSADHFMAHAIYGNFGFCVDNALKFDRGQTNHLKEWGNRFYAQVKGELGVVPGQIQHLWHGDTINRRYFLRMHEITDLGFNPNTDLIAYPGKPLEWANSIDKSELRDYFRNYFEARQEDGISAI